jgi:hypothetical protein
MKRFGVIARYQPGDCVVYHKLKFSAHPSPKARSVWPAPCGDYYSYCINKFYRVIAVGPNNQVVVYTRKGRRHTLAADDPALRRANFLERFLLRKRFPMPPVA